MRSATWSTHEAKWTYHPDNGLNLIITHAARPTVLALHK
jgi:hypothetical protein